MKSLGMRVCAAAVAAVSVVSASAVVSPDGIVGVQSASAEEISSLQVESAQFYTTAGEGGSPDPVGKVTDKETINQVGSLVMKIMVPESVKAGDTANFKLHRETEGNNTVEANGETYKYYFQKVDLVKGSRIPILDDPNDSTSVIGIVEVTSDSEFKITFTEGVEKYTSGEIRTLRLPVDTPPFVNGDFKVTLRPDSPTTPTDRSTPLTTKFYVDYAGKTTKVAEHTSNFNLTVNSDLRRASYDIDYIESGTDQFVGDHVLSTWMDELLYAVNAPGAGSRGAVTVLGAPQENPKDLKFSFQLPEGAVPLADPSHMSVLVRERGFVSYGNPKEQKFAEAIWQTYGYADQLEYGSDEDKPKVSFTYDEATRTYTGTVTNRTPDAVLQVDIYPSYTLPFTGELEEDIPVKFISGTSTQKVKKPGKDGKLEEFGSNKPIEKVGPAIGNPGEGDFEGRTPIVNFDLDVFVEDTRVDGNDVTGVTPQGGSSQAGSLDEAITVEDGEANYILKITNNSNVSLSAPRVTLPNGEVVYFTRPEDGSFKRWATPTDTGSKIAPGGVGYLVLPAEDIAMGTRPTQKDFKVEYQYSSQEGNTETTRTWVQRYLSDMHVLDVEQTGNEVKVSVGSSDEGVVDVYTFVMDEGVTSVTYDDQTGELIVERGDNDVTRLKISNPVISTNDAGNVVVAGVDDKNNPVTVTLSSTKYITNRIDSLDKNVQDEIAKITESIRFNQSLADNQAERIPGLQNDVRDAKREADEASQFVAAEYEKIEELIKRNTELTRTQIEQARDKVADAKQVIDNAVQTNNTAVSHLELAQDNLNDIRGRVNKAESSYAEVLGRYNASYDRLVKFGNDLKANELKLAQLKHDLRVAEQNADVNAENIERLRGEIVAVTEKVEQDRAAFEAEQKATAAHRKQLEDATTRYEGEANKVTDELARLGSRLDVIAEAIAKAQRDAEAVKQELIVSAERNPDNTIDLNRENGEKLVVPEANKRGLEKCATGVGGAMLASIPVMLLASTIVSQTNIPAIDHQIARVQKQVGHFNPQLASLVSANAAPIAAVVASIGLLGVLSVPGLCGEGSMFDAMRETATR